MNVISPSTLRARRLNELNRRRNALADEQQRLQRLLPDWAIEPLKLVGMTGAEIKGLVDDLSQTEQRIGLHNLEGEIERLDREIDEVEAHLIKNPADDLPGIEAVLNLALERLRETTSTTPTDVFYDHGAARVLALVERAASDLRDIQRDTTAQRYAS